MTGIVPLGQILRSVVKGLLGSARKNERARSAWAKAAGDDLAAQTQVTGMKDRILFVSTPNAPLRSELMFYRRGDLLRRLREIDPGLNVEDIRFYLDGRR